MDARGMIQQELADRGYITENLETPYPPDAGGTWALTCRPSEINKSVDPAGGAPRSHRASSPEALLSFVRSLPALV